MTIDTRTAIAAEAMILWSAVLLTQYEADNRAGKTGVPTYLGDIMRGPAGLNTAWKIALLFMILLIISEATNTAWPVYLGFMVVASGIVYEAATASQALSKLLGVSQ